MRTLTVLIIACMLLVSTNSASAFDCNTIRSFVAEHGRKAAITLALQKGYTWVQIKAAARACLTK